MLLVTDLVLMRGIDYRVKSGTMGISLLVMSGFCNKRSYVQALGRVGRFHEKAKRFVWDQLQEPVDKMAQIALVGTLRQQKVKPVVMNFDSRKKAGKNAPPPKGQRSVRDIFWKPIVRDSFENTKEETKEEIKEEEIIETKSDEV